MREKPFKIRERSEDSKRACAVVVQCLYIVHLQRGETKIFWVITDKLGIGKAAWDSNGLMKGTLEVREGGGGAEEIRG